MLALVSMMAVSLTACSSSDDDVDPTQQYRSRVLGEWFRGDSAYWFSEDGTGYYAADGKDYYSNEDVLGEFHWTITDLQIDITKMTIHNSYRVWYPNPIGARYDPETNTLCIDGKIFTRNAPAPKPREEPTDTVTADTVVAK